MGWRLGLEGAFASCPSQLAFQEFDEALRALCDESALPMVQSFSMLICAFIRSDAVFPTIVAGAVEGHTYNLK